jgi:hypothetical protein
MLACGALTACCEIAVRNRPCPLKLAGPHGGNPINGRILHRLAGIEEKGHSRRTNL